MTVNQEIKGNLAKLLATENLIIEHKKVPTACFDVNRRVLTLPIWNSASNAVYDMLVGHEVGHALYTPNEDWTDRCDAPSDYVNVIEDARIEKLMKRKFPGLARSFYLGYNELNQQDFFEINQELDLTKLSLIDRINLHFKIGVFALLPFLEEERQFVDMTANAETFDEVLEISSLVYNYLKKEESQAKSSESDLHDQNQQNGQSDLESNDEGEEEKEEENEGEKKESTQGTNENDGPQLSGGGGGRTPGGPEEISKTQRAFNQNSENLSRVPNWYRDTTYIEIPELILDNVIVDHKDLHGHINKYWSDLGKDRMKHWGDIFKEVDIEYNKYKISAQKEVNYLVKEFECKKSADAYSRSATSKTGTLNTKMLHSYKFNDDIFKKVTVIPDGKNHGLLFVLDWSGSMQNVLLDTVKQLLNLVWFCRKVQIPFEVYAFTYEWTNRFIDPEFDGLTESTKRKYGKIDINRLFSMLNFLSSRSNSNDFEIQTKNIWRMAYYFRPNPNSSVSYSCPPGMEMSGTPLNESIIALNQIIPIFKEREHLQKVNVVILTDGEGNNLTYNVEMQHNRYIGSHSISSNCALRDRKIGHIYRNFGGEYNNSLTAILLENLKDKFPEINLIGFRILSGGEFNRFFRHLKNITYEIPENINKIWRKEKSCEIHPVGYDALYALLASALSCDTEFDVSEDATPSEIGKAFRTMLKKKGTNKKILSSFASLVA